MDKSQLRFSRMKRPSDHEQAALAAAFSLCDAIDAINGTGVPDPPAERVAKRPTSKNTRRPGQHPDIWHGWHFKDDELIDGGGNRYGQSEIRAIFYTRKLLWHYQELERARRPVVKSEPVQLCFEAVPQAWKVLCNR